MNAKEHTRSAQSIFEPVGFVMIRVPLLSLDSLAPLMGQNQASPTFLIMPTLLSNAMERDMLAIREYLVAKASEPVIQEALLIGSSDLFQAVLDWQQTPSSKKGRKIETNLFRYLTRMTTRPTPFGLFAGVAMGYVGEKMNLRIGPLEQNWKHTRPNMQWLLYWVRIIEQRPGVIPHLRFFPNPLIFTAGGRLYIHRLDSYEEEEQEKTISLRATPIVMQVLALARQGATLSELKQQLLAERPKVTEKQVKGLLDGLRQQGVLLSELRPPLTGGDISRYVLERIKKIPDCEDIYEKMYKVLALAKAYDAFPVGQGITTLQDLLKATEVPNSKIRSSPVVDMGTDCKLNSFSASVAGEFAHAAEIMLRLSTAEQQFPHLVAYQREFIDRYGECREVPLLELLDEDIGLGPPPYYQHPPRRREISVPPTPEYPWRDHVLLELAAKALRNSQHEVELDEATLSQLQVNDSWWQTVPDSLELYGFVAASSEEEINNGNYRVVIGYRIGDKPAGRSFGRFCAVLGEDSVQSLTGLVREEEARHPQQIFAELVYMPTDARSANVAIRPALRHYEIVIAASPGVSFENTIPLDDLVVGVRDDRFYLRSMARDVEVVISSMHLLHYLKAPNECRFMAEISNEGGFDIAPFDWGVAMRLPHLPRVRVGRIILCPAEWHLPTGMIDMERHKLSFDIVWWNQYLQEWRRLWDVPRYVYLTDNDNRLLLDLENPLCVADLGDECWKRRASQDVVTLQEMLPGFADIWTEGYYGRYLVEFVTPLKCRQSRTKPDHSLSSMKYTTIPVNDRMRQIGSDWLFAKLYSGRTRHDDLIAGPIREFVHQSLQNGWADRWFFIRYADPEPHIRLRFQGTPSSLLSQLLPALITWSHSLIGNGLLRKLVLDSYDREIERYGGLEGMQLAEQIFAVDSTAVADIIALRLQRVLELSSTDLAILTVDNLLTNLGLLANERLNLYQTLRQMQEKAFGSRVNQLQKIFHSYRKDAQRIIGDRNWLYAQSGGSKLAECLQVRASGLLTLREQLHRLTGQELLSTSQVSFLASCVHMHCNRLLGINRELEREVIYYLECTLDSLRQYVPNGIQVK